MLISLIPVSRNRLHWNDYSRKGTGEGNIQKINTDTEKEIYSVIPRCLR